MGKTAEQVAHTLHGTGELVSGNAATLGGKVDSNEICKDLRAAEEASDIQAVVLRIDSSGFSSCHMTGSSGAKANFPPPLPLYAYLT